MELHNINKQHSPLALLLRVPIDVISGFFNVYFKVEFDVPLSFLVVMVSMWGIGTHPRVEPLGFVAKTFVRVIGGIFWPISTPLLVYDEMIQKIF